MIQGRWQPRAALDTPWHIADRRSRQARSVGRYPKPDAQRQALGGPAGEPPAMAHRKEAQAQSLSGHLHPEWAQAGYRPGTLSQLPVITLEACLGSWLGTPSQGSLPVAVDYAWRSLAGDGLRPSRLAGLTQRGLSQSEQVRRESHTAQKCRDSEDLHRGSRSRKSVGGAAHRLNPGQRLHALDGRDHILRVLGAEPAQETTLRNARCELLREAQTLLPVALIFRG